MNIHTRTVWDGLMLLCLASLVCCQSSPKPPLSSAVYQSERKDGDEIIVPVTFVLDLSARQYLITETRGRLTDTSMSDKGEVKDQVLQVAQPHYSQILRELNLVFKETRFRFKLKSLQAWESTQEGRLLPFSELADELKTRRIIDPKRYEGLVIGLVSTPPPSFAQLDDLRWALLGEPIVVVRELTSFYQGLRLPARTAMVRMVTRSIIEFLGAAPSCEKGWGSAERDELLGLISTPSLGRSRRRVNPQQGQLSQAEPLITTDDKLDEAFHFNKLSWGHATLEILDNAASRFRQSGDLMKRDYEQSCQDWRSLQRVCATPNYLTRALGEACFQNEDRLLSAYEDGELRGEFWAPERQTARGLQALRESRFQDAFTMCSPIARHRPALAASRCAGLAAQQLNQDSTAVIYLRAYLSTHPRDLMTKAALAKSLGRLGKDEEAVALLRSLAGEPSDLLGEQKGRILFNLGVGAARLGDWDEAVSAWDRMSPRDEDYREAMKLKSQRPPQD